MQHSIEWYRCERQATDERIDFVSKEIGVHFPKTFVALMKECDGGVPEISSFEYQNVFLNIIMGEGLGSFMGFEEKDYAHDHLLGHHQSQSNFLPKHVIAFGYTGGGDYICFDYRKETQISEPEIIYWSHSAPEDQNISFIAKNFDAFMAMLHPFDESLLD